MDQGIKGSWIGHAFGNPDDIELNREQYNKAEAASKNYVLRFLQRK